MPNWYEQIVEVYDPSDLNFPKSIIDNGRTVDHLNYIKAEGEWEKNGLGSGSFEIDAADRDSNPLLSKGNIAHCIVKSITSAFVEHTVACFVIEKFVQNENDDGTGTLTVSGTGIGVELTRKLFTDKYIMGEITGTAQSVGDNNTDWIIDLEVGHGQVDDYYKGDVIVIGGKEGQIDSYQTAVDRIRVKTEDWFPSPPSEGTNVPYLIYKGPALDDIEKALAPVPDWFTNNTGTTNGTMHVNVGKYVWDVINDIANQSGEFFRFNVGPPSRIITFDDGTSPFPSGAAVYGFQQQTPAFVDASNARSYTLNVERTVEIVATYTKLYGIGSDVTLADLPVSEQVVPTGFTIYPDESLIVYDTANIGKHSSEVVEKYLEYNDIAARNNSAEAKGDAAIILRDSMLTDLLKNNPDVWGYSFETILRSDPQPLQTIRLNFVKQIPGTAETAWSVNADLFIHKITHSCGDDTGGMRITKFECYDRLDYQHKDGESMVADLLKRQSYATSGGLVIFGSTASGSKTKYFAGSGIAIDASNTISFKALDVAGNGLVSSGSSTLNAVGNNGILVTTGAIEINPTIAGSALLFSSGVLSVDPTIAGAGLSHANGVVYVNTGDGIKIDTDAVVISLGTDSGLRIGGSGGLNMGTPTSSGAKTSNNVSGENHSHNIIGFSNATANPGDLLESDGNGRIQLSGLGVGTSASANEIRSSTNLVFTQARNILSEAGDIRIQPAGDLYLEPLGNQVMLPTNADLQGELFQAGGPSAQGVQFKIDTGNGAGYFKYIYADELRVTLFQADVSIAKAGALIVTPGMGELSRNFIIPAVSNSTTLYVRDNPAALNLQIFEAFDYVRMRYFEQTAGGLSLFDVWGQVTNYSDLADGEQSWTFTTKKLTNAGIAGETIGAGVPVLGYGQSGQGWWEVTTLDDLNSPYTRIRTWKDFPYAPEGTLTTHMQTGQLNLITSNDEWGLFAGVSNVGPRAVITDRAAEFHDIAISLYAGAGDNASIRLYGIELNSNLTTNIRPNGDLSQSEVLRSSGSNAYYTYINEEPSADGDYLQNTGAKSAHAWFNLTDINHNLTSLEARFYAVPTGFNDDICQLRVQVFKADQTTPLTDNMRLCRSNETVNLRTIEFTFAGESVATGSDADWANARLKIEWLYYIAGGGEVVRLDPKVPSIAVGSPVPTGTGSGGSGFWVGNAGNEYRLRIGDAGGAGLVWTGSALNFRNSSNQDVITLDNAGNSYFSGIMTIGSNGQITAGATQLDDEGILLGTMPIDPGEHLNNISASSNSIKIGSPTALNGALYGVRDVIGNTVVKLGSYGTETGPANTALAISTETENGEDTSIWLYTTNNNPQNSYMEFKTEALVRLLLTNDYADLDVHTRIDSSHGLAVGAQNTDPPARTIFIQNQTGDPTTSGSGVLLYAKNGELYVRDSSGNVKLLS